ncbi:unnamed protein product [Aphanomyces euteiches]
MSTVAKSRNKERAKENRRLRKEELAYLRSRVTELSRQLHAETKMLPWQEVAHALQSESSTAQETNRALRRDIIRTTVLLECLLALVAGPMARSPETSPFVQASGWKNQAILGIDGEARVASFQWLLSRLFHNTDMAYAQCPNTPSVRIDINYDNHYISGCRGAQYIVPAPMDQAVRTLDGLIKCDIFFDRDNPTYLYDQEVQQYSGESHLDVNVLVCSFCKHQTLAQARFISALEMDQHISEAVKSLRLELSLHVAA